MDDESLDESSVGQGQLNPTSIGYPSEKAYIDPRVPIRKKINFKLEILRKEIKELEDAITTLDANPEFEKLHDVLTRVSRFL